MSNIFLKFTRQKTSIRAKTVNLHNVFTSRTPLKKKNFVSRFIYREESFLGRQQLLSLIYYTLQITLISVLFLPKAIATSRLFFIILLSLLQIVATISFCGIYKEVVQTLKCPSHCHIYNSLRNILANDIYIGKQCGTAYGASQNTAHGKHNPDGFECSPIHYCLSAA